MLRVMDSCCSFQDVSAAGLLLTPLKERERSIKYEDTDPTLSFSFSLSAQALQSTSGGNTVVKMK